MGDDRPATKEELLGFFNHIEAELERLGFFNPPHKRPTVVRNLRTMFSRMARHGAGGPHPSWYCCHARERQGKCPQAVQLTAIIWPSFQPSDAAPNEPELALFIARQTRREATVTT